jgi:hypothetical protein
LNCGVFLAPKISPTASIPSFLIETAKRPMPHGYWIVTGFPHCELCVREWSASELFEGMGAKAAQAAANCERQMNDLHKIAAGACERAALD